MVFKALTANLIMHSFLPFKIENKMNFIRTQRLDDLINMMPESCAQEWHISLMRDTVTNGFLISNLQVHSE